SVSPATGRLHPDGRPCLELHSSDAPAHFLTRALMWEEEQAGRTPLFSAGKAWCRRCAPVRTGSEIHVILPCADLTRDAPSAPPLPGTSTVAHNAIFIDEQGVFDCQGFDRQVGRIGYVHMRGILAIQAMHRPGATAQCFKVDIHAAIAAPA